MISIGYFNVYPFNSNIMIPNGADFTVKWVKLEVGSIATPLVPRPYAEELMLCKRYGRYIYVDYTINAASNSFSNMMSVPIDMRIAPTLTLSVKTHITIYFKTQSNFFSIIHERLFPI